MNRWKDRCLTGFCLALVLYVVCELARNFVIEATT